MEFEDLQVIRVRAVELRQTALAFDSAAQQADETDMRQLIRQAEEAVRLAKARLGREIAE